MHENRDDWHRLRRLVTGACFANSGNQVECVDIDQKKVQALRAGDVPIYEPGLTEIVQRNTAEGRLTFTTDLAAAVSKSATSCMSPSERLPAKTDPPTFRRPVERRG